MNMEQDNLLKEILQQSAAGASPQFTEAVMKKVTTLSQTPFYRQPLVSRKLKRLFLYTFVTLVFASFVLCVLASPTNVNIINWIQTLPFSAKDYTNALTFILCFWIVFAVNALLQKKGVLSRRALFL